MGVDGHWTIDAVEVPMPLDTLIKPGMLADVEGHGDRIPIKRISVALCPRRDPAAEDSERALAGRGAADEALVTAAEVEAIEAVMLPYAVFDFGEGGWGYGRQIKRVYNADGSDYEG